MFTDCVFTGLNFTKKTLFLLLPVGVMMFAANTAVSAGTVFKEHKKIADDLYDQKEFRKAIKELNIAIADEPDNFEGYYKRGKCYSETESPQEAMPDLNKALSMNPKFADIWVSRGLAYRRLNDDVKALQDFKHAVALNPHLAKAYWKVFDVCTKEHDYKTAVKYATHAISNKVEVIKNYQRRGMFYALSGDRSQMESDFSTAVNLGKVELAEAEKKYSVDEKELRDKGIAETEIDKIKKKSEENIGNERKKFANIYNERGKAYASVKDFNSAMNDFETALKIVPNDSTYLCNVGAVLLLTNQNQRALDVLNEACRLRDDSASIHNNHGIALERLGKHAEAKLAFEQALKYDKKVNYYSNHARVAQAVGDSAEVVSDYIGISSLGKSKKSTISEKSLHTVIDQFTALIKLNPNDPANYYNRGVVFLSQSKFAEAKNDFTTFLKLQNGVGESPTYGSILLSIALQNMHQKKDAAEVIFRAQSAADTNWTKQLLSLYSGESSLADFMDAHECRQKVLAANCLIGLKELAEGKKNSAVEKLYWVKGHGIPAQDEYLLAVSGLNKINGVKPGPSKKKASGKALQNMPTLPEVSFK